MKIAVVGAGAMGSVFGGMLAQGGQEVTLIDVWRESVEAINAHGLRVEDRAGEVRTARVPATTDPADVGPVDLVLVFVKCYHTEEAVRRAAPLLGPGTAVLSLQNGWGNAPRIDAIVGAERVLVGVTYHSATVLGPGRVQHAGRGMTFVGELDGSMSDRLRRLAEAFSAAGIEVTTTPEVIREIWSKLALNVCTLPTSALLRFYAGQLIEHEGTLNLMRGLLREAVAVARAQEIALDEEERWTAITGLLQRASGAKASMLQDVEKGNRTEIDVVNGAIVDAGRRLGIPTPYNDAMLWLVRSLEETYSKAARSTKHEARSEE
jgi:2-dehydropantoate 2-reductase